MERDELISFMRSALEVLQEDEEDLAVKKIYQEYLKFDDAKIADIGKKFISVSTEYEVSLTHVISLMAKNQAREQTRKEFCMQEELKRPKLSGKTAELYDLIEHYSDDKANEFKQYVDYSKIYDLVFCKDVDLHAIPFDLGSILTSFLKHVNYNTLTGKQKRQYLKIVDHMLDDGVDPNLEDAYGFTAINYVFDNLNIIKTLKNHGADITHVVNDKFNEITSQRSIMGDNIMTLAFVDNFDETEKIVNYLVDNGFDKNVEPNDMIKACVDGYFDPYSAFDDFADSIFLDLDELSTYTAVLSYGFKRRYKMLKGEVTPEEFKIELNMYTADFLAKLGNLQKANSSSTEELEKAIAQCQEEYADIFVSAVFENE